MLFVFYYSILLVFYVAQHWGSDTQERQTENNWQQSDKEYFDLREQEYEKCR